QSWYAFAKGTASLTITVAGCAGSWSDILADEFSGVSAVDVTAQVTGSGAIGQALALTQANELVWCGALGTLSSPGTGFTIGANDGSQDLSEYQIAAGLNSAISFPNSGSYIALMAAFAPIGAVPQMPVISSFSANPATISVGSSSTLSWATSGADSVSISGIGSVALSGSLSVSPSSTTVYMLTASNAVGSNTAQATVTVQAAPP